MNARNLLRFSAALWFAPWLACSGSEPAAPAPAPAVATTQPAAPAPAAEAPAPSPTDPVPEAAEPTAPVAAALDELERKWATPDDDPGEPAPKPAGDPAAPAPKPAPKPKAPARQETPTAPAKPAAQTEAPAKPENDPPAPPPTTPAPEPPPAPAKPASQHVLVPRTDHVRVDVPQGLQTLLDADPRMQPWLNEVMGVVDRCYASTRKSAPAAEGTITLAITMHENSRPDADVGSVPGALGGVIACATPELLRARPPLFTGPEGQRHTVHVRFSP